MCKPPEICLTGKLEVGIDQGACNDWSYSADAWSSPDQGASDASLHGSSVPSVPPGQRQQPLLLNLDQNQFQQRTPATHFAALAAPGAPAAPQQQSWANSFHQNLTERLQRAAQAAAAAGKDHHPPEDALPGPFPWMKHQPSAPALYTPPSPSLSSAPAAPPMWAPYAAPMPMPQRAAPLMQMPVLVAQGFPFGVPQMVGQLDPAGCGQEPEHGEEDDDMDAKKYKRMMSNRASAKRSRQRRQERLDELEIVSVKLQVENATVQRKLNETNECIRKFQEENEALLAELQSLKEMVESRGCGSPCGAATLTKQDSCDPNGSDSGTPSRGSAPVQKVTGKRCRDEVAESRLLIGSGKGAAVDGVLRSGHVTPTSAVTSGLEKGAGFQRNECVAVGAEAPHKGAQFMALDDELFTSLIDECFDAKPQ